MTQLELATKITNQNKKGQVNFFIKYYKSESSLHRHLEESVNKTEAKRKGTHTILITIRQSVLLPGISDITITLLASS